MDLKPSHPQEPLTQPVTSKPAPTFYPVPAAGALRISGPDRRDFLQRQTTNDLALLTDSRPLVTVLTSPTARILDVLTLINVPDPESGEQALLALTLPGRANATAAYLKGKIFFMDNVTVADVSAIYRQIEVPVPGGDSLLAALGFREAADLPAVDSITFHGTSLTLLRQAQLPPRLVVAASQETELLARLRAEQAVALSPEDFEIARVETGRPGPQNELSADYTPLENNMGWAISGTKGCYTGQEVIARQITYDKVTRKLVGVQLATEVAAGSKVWAGKQAAGTVTSAVLSGRYGPIALAMIKRPHFETGTQVTIGEPDNGVSGKIVDLPFSREA